MKFARNYLLVSSYNLFNKMYLLNALNFEQYYCREIFATKDYDYCNA